CTACSFLRAKRSGLLEGGRTAKPKVVKRLVVRGMSASIDARRLLGLPVPAAAAHDLVAVAGARLRPAAGSLRVDPEARLAARLVAACVPVGDPFPCVPGHV